MKIINAIELILCVIIVIFGIVAVIVQIYLGAIRSFIGVLAAVIGLAGLCAMLYISIDEYKSEEKDRKE